MNLSGYLITTTPQLDLAGTFGVRYAARLHSGEGFAAFDAPDPAAVYELGRLGRVLMAPWPWMPRMPKRGVAVGDETFTLLKPNVSAEALMDHVERFTRGAVIVVEDGLPYVLVETGRNMLDPGIWQGRAVEHRDVRELVEA